MKHEVFTKDWFSNRNELGKYNFNKDNAIYNINNNVSKILYGAKFNELYENPRILEKECEALNIIINKNKPAKVTIQNQSNTCYTDGQKIVISGAPLKEFKENGIDIIFGYLSHESSHIRFTDFYYCKESALKHKFVKWVWNLIEDEVIEEMLQIEKPGLGNLLGPVKDYTFKKDKTSNFNNELDEILYILFNKIRYPKNLEVLNNNIFDKHKDTFEKIYLILKSNNIFDIDINKQVTKDNYKAACEIFELLKDLIKNEEIEISGTGNTVPGKDCQGNDGESLSGKNLSNEEIENILDGMFDENGEISIECFDDIDCQMFSDSIGENVSKDFVSNKIKELSKFEINVEDYDPEYNENEFEEDSNRGNIPTGNLRIKTKKMKKSNTIQYNNIAKECKPYIKLIKDLNIQNKVKNMTLNKEEMVKNGSLDPRLLASAIQNVKNVYQRFGVKYNKEKDKKFTIVLTLDESGSMCSKQTRNIVNKIAISFAEAFKNNNNIDLYIYGHNDYVVQYVNPKTKYFDILIHRFQGGGQNEVYAYNTIIQDVLKETNSNILLVNITDSQYLANYSEIEKVLKNFNKNIFQSLIVINNKVTQKDIEFNNKLYGKDTWGIITNIDDIEKTSYEIKKVIKYINKLWNKWKK